eukprot:907975-Pelagomonas_calceolata.AAC.2
MGHQTIGTALMLVISQKHAHSSTSIHAGSQQYRDRAPLVPQAFKRAQSSTEVEHRWCLRQGGQGAIGKATAHHRRCIHTRLHERIHAGTTRLLHQLMPSRKDSSH